LENEEDIERRRLADLGFANWEPCREYLAIAREMAREQEAEDEDMTSFFAFPTVVKPANAISETPLPTVFRRTSRPCYMYYI
jgi:hypothetical protein